MKEIKDIIKAYDEATKLGKQTALTTVVHVEGSSCRRPGARKLVTEDGNLTGAISPKEFVAKIKEWIDKGAVIP